MGRQGLRVVRCVRQICRVRELGGGPGNLIAGYYRFFVFRPFYVDAIGFGHANEEHVGWPRGIRRYEFSASKESRGTGGLAANRNRVRIFGNCHFGLVHAVSFKGEDRYCRGLDVW